MREVTDDIDSLLSMLSENEYLLYHPIKQISFVSSSRILTDDRSYIAAQDDPMHPLWIWLREGGKPSYVEKDITDIISWRLEENPSLEVMGPFSLFPLIRGAASRFSASSSLSYRCTGYALFSLMSHMSGGSCSAPDMEDAEECARLVKEMYRSSMKRELLSSEALTKTLKWIEKGEVRVWRDRNGKVVSLLRICYEDERIARINTVVTLPSERQKGYCSSLITSVSEELMSWGKTPLLYAVSDYLPSNRCYRRLGFTETGVLASYKITY